MSVLQRFLSQKIYEWQRRKMRTQHKKQTSGGSVGNLPIKVPQIVGFKIEGNKTSKPPYVAKGSRNSGHRGRREGQIQLKKVAGIMLIAIGCLLLLTKCFGGKEEEKALSQDEPKMLYKAEQVDSLTGQSLESFIQDFNIEPKTLHTLFRYANKYRDSYAHTLSVWALESYEGKSQQAIFKTLRNPQLIGKDKEYEYANSIYKQFIYDIQSFPLKSEKGYMYENGWKQKRTYNGERLHYGIDLMAIEDKPGILQVVSITDGIIENIGWNELGGYRVGIRSEGGAYFYYAHLNETLSELKKGDQIYAGQCIGYMGNTGYGVEGTKGKFPVHLHVGISVTVGNNKEYWINPYSVLKYLERYGEK